MIPLGQYEVAQVPPLYTTYTPSSPPKFLFIFLKKNTKNPLTLWPTKILAHLILSQLIFTLNFRTKYLIIQLKKTNNIPNPRSIKTPIHRIVAHQYNLTLHFYGPKKSNKRETCQDFHGNFDTSFCVILWYKL